MRTLGQICATALLLTILSVSTQAEGWIVANRRSTAIEKFEPTTGETGKVSNDFNEIYESVLFLLKTTLFLG